MNFTKALFIPTPPLATSISQLNILLVFLVLQMSADKLGRASLYQRPVRLIAYLHPERIQSGQFIGVCPHFGGNAFYQKNCGDFHFIFLFSVPK